MAKHYQSSAVLRDRAKGSLNGKYGISVGIVLLKLVFTLSFSIFLSNIVSLFPGLSDLDAQADPARYMVSFIIVTLISFLASVLIGVFNVGIYLFFLKAGCRQYPSVSDIFQGFRENFAKHLTASAIVSGVPSFVLMFYQILEEYYQISADSRYLFISLGAGILGLVFYVFWYLNFGMTYFIINDFNDYSAAEAARAAVRKMKGQKGRLFKLELSFVPLWLLGILSLGVGFIWIVPYTLETRAHFYLDLMNAKEVTYTWERTV